MVVIGRKRKEVIPTDADRVQEIAATLLKKYCDHFYNAKRMDYEKDKLEYRYLDEVEAELLANGKPGNIFDEYTFLVEKSRVDIIEKLKELPLLEVVEVEVEVVEVEVEVVLEEVRV